MLNPASNPLNQSVEGNLRKKLVDPPSTTIDLSSKNGKSEKEDYVKRLLKSNTLFMNQNRSFSKDLPKMGKSRFGDTDSQGNRSYSSSGSQGAGGLASRFTKTLAR